MPDWDNNWSKGQVRPVSEDLAPSAARTTTGSAAVPASWGGVVAARLQLDVTAASGTTPTLDVALEDSMDGTNWNTVKTFAQKVTTGREVVSLTPTDVFTAQLRVRWTIGGGTPSFTFSVKAVPVR